MTLIRSCISDDGSRKDKVVPTQEIVDQYREMMQELKILREKFLQAVASNDEKNARAYSASLKDYRSIQVKLIQAMQKMGDLHPYHCIKSTIHKSQSFIARC